MSLRVVGASALMALAFSIVMTSPAAAQLMDPATPEQIAEELRASGFKADVHPPTNSNAPTTSPTSSVNVLNILFNMGSAGRRPSDNA